MSDRLITTLERIADNLDLLLKQQANPIMTLSPDYEDRQWFTETQVLNMLVGAGFIKNDTEEFAKIQSRQRSPLPVGGVSAMSQDTGMLRWWGPEVFAWMSAERERRKNWKLGAAKRQGARNARANA